MRVDLWHRLLEALLPTVRLASDSCNSRAAGILQRPVQHCAHPSGGKNACFCVVTSYLNPLLDPFGFWVPMERVFGPPVGT